MFKLSTQSTRTRKSLVARYCLFLLSLVSWLATGSASVARGQPCTGASFRAAINIEVGVNNPNSVAVGDLNGDGHLDIAVGGGDNYIAILFGHGTGTFEAPTKLLGYVVSSLAIGDFNGDGRPDLAAASLGRARVLIFSGNASHSLDDAVEYSIGGFDIRNLVAGDLNNDGKPDLAATILNSSEIGILLTNSSGGFNPPLILTSVQRPNYLGVADFNLDGKADLLATSSSIAANVVVLLGDGGGNFSPINFTISDSFSGPQVGDFNSDGKPDLAVKSFTASDTTVLYFGNGAGSFGPRVLTAAKITPSIVADFNGDGRTDVGGFGGAGFRALLADGSGNFSVTEEMVLGVGIGDFATGDFNGDSNIDLVSANGDSDDISVLLGTGPASFESARNYPFSPLGPTGPTASVATGDFNGDGKVDYVVPDRTRNRINFFDGDGTGGFTLGRVVDIAIPVEVFMIAGDYNGDGRSDLAALLSEGAVLFIFGGLPGTKSVITGPSPILIANGDLNGDNKLDLAVVQPTNVGILLGDGAGNFAPLQLIALGSSPTGVAIGDFNGDSKADLAIANSTPNTVSILLGNGVGGFALSNSLSAPHSNTERLVVASDLNSDGKTDLAVLPKEGNLTIYLGDGAGQFAQLVDYAVGIFPIHMIVADLNLDGHPDLGVVNSESGTISLLMGIGGGFAMTTNFGVGAIPNHADVGDFNGDGRPDLIVSNRNSGSVTVILGAPCRPPDITITKSHSGDFAVGSPGSYRLKVSNLGRSRTVGPTVTTDALPPSLTLISAEGVGWNCSGSQTVTCTHDGSFASGESSVVTVSVLATAGAVPGVINTASVSNASEQNVANNTVSDPTVVGLGAGIMGHITNENGNALSGVTVFLSGALQRQTTSDAAGNYSFTGLPEELTYTVTPSKTTFGFGPANRVFTLLQGNATADFKGRSQTNGRIVFARNVGGNFDIFSMDANGSDVRQLTTGPAFDERPTWSPDGKRIAFQRTNGSFGDIFLMDADGANLRNLTNGEGFEPAWSPDGKKISFYKQNVGIAGIYTMNADGSNQERIVPYDGSPSTSTSWSPDGSSMAFSKLNIFVPDSGDIYLMHPDGRYQTPITANNQLADSDAHFSPDGTKLVYVSGHQANSAYDVVTANTDGTNRMSLASASSVAAPAWAPDGGKVVFITDDDIFTVNVDGTGLINLTNTIAAEKDPEWQPITTFPLPFPNPVDDASFFVRQHYLDFLTRDADQAGLNFWTNQIAECGSDTACREVRRINVSAAFFLSIEFQETGYLAYRTYKAAYGNVPGTPVPIRLNEFFPDTEDLSQNVVVGVPGWQQNLERNKQAYFSSFIARARFEVAYPTAMTPAQFVDALYLHAGVTPSSQERSAAINEFGSEMFSADRPARARVVRRVAENDALGQQERNSAFVLMQYFGYLRRNPDDPPNADFSGYDFWLTKLNQFNGNFVNAEMVKAFLVSGEYRQRFGQ